MNEIYEARRQALTQALRQVLAANNTAGSPAPGEQAVLDQTRAAYDEAIGLVQPHRDSLTAEGCELSFTTDYDPADLIGRVAAALSFGRWMHCSHARRNPAQLIVINLPGGRVDCARCAADNPPPESGYLPGNEDRCDLCGERGLDKFWSLVVQLMHWQVFGSVCDRCAAAFGVAGAVGGVS